MEIPKIYILSLDITCSLDSSYDVLYLFHLPRGRGQSKHEQKRVEKE